MLSRLIKTEPAILVHCTFRGGYAVKIICSRLKRVLQSVFGSHSFLLEQIPFQDGVGVRKANGKSQEMSPLKKMSVTKYIQSF